MSLGGSPVSSVINMCRKLELQCRRGSNAADIRHVHNVRIQRWQQWSCFVDSVSSRTTV